MRDIYNLFQYYDKHNFYDFTEDIILDRAKEKLCKNLFTHQEFYIAVEKSESNAKDAELPVHLEEAEFNTRIYICLSRISVYMAKKKLEEKNVDFVPVSRDEVLRIAGLGKKISYFNFYFPVHNHEVVLSAEKVFESMTTEKRFLFYDLSKINHYVPFLGRVNAFLLVAFIVLWIYPYINPLFLNEVGLKRDSFERMSSITITRYRGDAKHLFLKRPKTIYNVGFSIGTRAFSNNPNIETVTLNFDYDEEWKYFNLTKIKRFAFYECPNLRRIDLPMGLLQISRVAFCSLPSLETLYIPPTVYDLNDGIIYADCPNLKTIYITESLYRKYEEDFIKENEKENLDVEFIFIDEFEEKSRGE